MHTVDQSNPVHTTLLFISGSGPTDDWEYCKDWSLDGMARYLFDNNSAAGRQVNRFKAFVVTSSCKYAAGGSSVWVRWVLRDLNM